MRARIAILALGTIGLVPAVAAQPRVASAELGGRACYRLSYEARLEPGPRLTLAGIWTLVTSTENGGRREVLATLAVDSLAAEDAAGLALPAAETSGLAVSLGNPHALIWDRTGDISEVGFIPGTPRIAQNILTALAALVSLSSVLPTDGDWEREEEDGSGRYRARYRRQGPKITREKLRYERADSGNDTAPEVTVVVGETVFELGLSASIARIAAQEELRVKLPSPLPEVASRSRLQLERLESCPGPELEPDRATLAFTRRSPAAKSTAEELQQARDAALVAGRSFADLLAVLTEAPVRADRDLAFLALIALFRLDSRATNQAARALRQGHPRSIDLLWALGEAGTPAAQEALRGLVVDFVVERPTGLQALARAEHFTPATLEFLMASLDDPELAPVALPILDRRSRDPGSAEFECITPRSDGAASRP